MKSIEVSAKKVEDAINEGLKILGTTIDEVDVEIISQGGLFKKAKVKLTFGAAEPSPIRESAAEPAPTKVEAQSRETKPLETAPQNKPQAKPEEKPSQKANHETKPSAPHSEKPQRTESSENLDKRPSKPQQKERFDKDREKRPVSQETADIGLAFLKQTLSLMGVDAALTAELSDGLSVNIESEDSAVIGYRGETLDALEYLTSLAVNAEDDKYVKVRLNCNEYREKRIKILENLALKMADKCIKQQRKVILEPMNSLERRAIHAALSDSDQVFTKSEGSEPNRHIVILYKRDKKN